MFVYLFFPSSSLFGALLARLVETGKRCRLKHVRRNRQKLVLEGDAGNSRLGRRDKWPFDLLVLKNAFFLCIYWHLLQQRSGYFFPFYFCWFGEELSAHPSRFGIFKTGFNEHKGNSSADISRKWRSCSVHSLTRYLFPTEQSIYFISTVLSLHNRIITDLQSHTCSNAIWLEAGSISSA